MSDPVFRVAGQRALPGSPAHVDINEVLVSPTRRPS